MKVFKENGAREAIQLIVSMAVRKRIDHYDLI